MERPTQIMVAVDFSRGALRAVEAAVKMAERVHGELDLVHVFSFSLKRLVFSDGEIEAIGQAEKALADLRKKHLPGGLTVRTHISLGTANVELLRQITALKPDLVVVGSRGASPLGRMLLGSVSRYLSEHSAVPVLVVPVDRETQAEAALTPIEFKSVAACSACGHIRRRLESHAHCAHCGASPAHWDTAPLLRGPADADEAAVGAPLQAGEEESMARTTSGTSVGFCTSFPGGERTDVNPELRIRF